MATSYRAVVSSLLAVCFMKPNVTDGIQFALMPGKLSEELSNVSAASQRFLAETSESVSRLRLRTWLQLPIWADR